MKPKKKRSATRVSKSVVKLKRKTHQEAPPMSEATKKRIAAQRCACGKVVTDQPVEDCLSCTFCGDRMHTLSDVRQHEECGRVTPRSAPEGSEVPEAAEKSQRGGRRLKTGVPAKRSAVEVTEQIVPRWEVFFQCQCYPILRSEVLTALMAGTPLEVERMPSASLLDVVLLATATRSYLDAEIVNDYDELLRRAEEEWSRPEWTCKVFSQQHAGWANWILKGKRSFDCPEEAYIPDLAAWYLAQPVPEYFKQELTESEPRGLVPGALAARKRADAVAKDTAKHITKVRARDAKKRRAA